MVPPKPSATGAPPIWATKRQALCEALPWYKCYQGSLFSQNINARAMLIDGFGAKRDMMTSDIVITSLGGGRVKQQDGSMQSEKEARECGPRAVRTRMLQQLPIGLIVGEKCPFMPVEAPYPYNVMGWFTITDIWVEKNDNETFTHKVRLEKNDKSAQSWWEPQQSALNELPATTTALSYSSSQHDCIDCGESYKQIFAQGWVCLNGNCNQHFLLETGQILSNSRYAADPAAPLAWCKDCRKPSKIIFESGWTCLNKHCKHIFELAPGVIKEDLVYSADFLQERNDCCPANEPLKPEVPDLDSSHHGTEAKWREGIVCPKCNGCSRRRDWESWIYETPGCDFEVAVAPRTYSLAAVIEEETQLTRSKKKTEIKPQSGIISKTLKQGAWQVEQFLLPSGESNAKIIGSVHIFRATPTINAREGGPNDMWNECGKPPHRKLGLKRNPVRTPGHKTEMLTAHFQQNWGAPYKFVVNVHSKGFDNAPDMILKSLMRLRWAGRKAVHMLADALGGDDGHANTPSESLEYNFVDFNELLFLGYMQNDHISFHDDGESTLGPTVATLSLGSPAVMSFRLKAKYRQAKREAKNEEQPSAKRAKVSDKATKVTVSKLSEDINGSENKKDEKSPVIKFPVYHGDMIVMHGAEIHKYYEHAVDPKGMRRFALTSRHIDLDKLDETTRAEAEVKGTVPAKAAAFAYDGM